MSQRVFDVDHPWTTPMHERELVVGGKAANLNLMRVQLGLPVPPAFTVSTQACNEYLATGEWPEGLEDELRDHMRGIEAQVHRGFGDPADPLLVSVRSGAPVSMPGMMDTILNLGLTEATVPALAAAASNPEFAADCYDRLVHLYREVVGAELPQDPWEQLKGAVIAVFRSWNSDRARAYREVENIPDDLGTGVTVQAMVFGNRSGDSGTGVLFTRNPSTGTNELYGDVLLGAQGEDVVAGTHDTKSISDLATQMPDIYDELRSYALRLERHFADMCDIEFTIEQARLWMLQVRVGKRSPQAALRIAIDMADDVAFPLSRREAVDRVASILLDPPHGDAAFAPDAEVLGEGLAASPGVAAGHVVTDPALAASRGKAGEAVILVRHETSPNDVHGMAKAAGILTATGGLASHAAVVARGWNIPAVVGATCVRVAGWGVLISGVELEPDAVVTIDGSTGRILRGDQVGPRAQMPEVALLLGWAEGLGVDLTSGGEVGAAPAARAARSAGMPLDADQLLRTLAIKGFGTAESLAQALAADAAVVESLLEGLVDADLATSEGGAAVPTDAGRERGLALIAEDGRAAGLVAAKALLDEFVPLDKLMKDVVQAWQLKSSSDGSLVANDHCDHAYDAAVFRRVEALHEQTSEALSAHVDRFPRLGSYLGRLDAAAAQVAAEQGLFIASPRVDSYHGVWFELHEELINLSNTTRSAEVDAGRA
ncbi:pyruvate, phosphate dikinase [Isoptericola sp. b490]|uniref:pyruvate, phosphate dikinase n=1 Tax=Actinotalea lenta TaxID=3064654 RepID=UPI0027141547|nr:pyruvate, phosphate dikinase [Isoptericola sp. b490]MDO8119772.1 pyruvate, phosphate dikinase [Isoptericola sp. b490]